MLVVAGIHSCVKTSSARAVCPGKRVAASHGTMEHCECGFDCHGQTELLPDDLKFHLASRLTDYPYADVLEGQQNTDSWKAESAKSIGASAAHDVSRSQKRTKLKKAVNMVCPQHVTARSLQYGHNHEHLALIATARALRRGCKVWCFDDSGSPCEKDIKVSDVSVALPACQRCSCWHSRMCI
jgi:hypothetical protein